MKPFIWWNLSSSVQQCRRQHWEIGKKICDTFFSWRYRWTISISSGQCFTYIFINTQKDWWISNNRTNHIQSLITGLSPLNNGHIYPKYDIRWIILVSARLYYRSSYCSSSIKAVWECRNNRFEHIKTDPWELGIIPSDRNLEIKPYGVRLTQIFSKSSFWSCNMPFETSSRSSEAHYASGGAAAAVAPVVGGTVFFKHQSAYTTERIDASGRTSKVEAVRNILHSSIITILCSAHLRQNVK